GKGSAKSSTDRGGSAGFASASGSNASGTARAGSAAAAADRVGRDPTSITFPSPSTPAPSSSGTYAVVPPRTSGQCHLTPCESARANSIAFGYAFHGPLPATPAA